MDVDVVGERRREEKAESAETGEGVNRDVVEELEEAETI